MLDYFDIKSALIGGALSLAAGGGLYGLYIKIAGQTAMSELSAYQLLQRCVVLRVSKGAIPARKKEVDFFLNEVENESRKIAKADAVLTTIAAAGGKDAPGGMGIPLQICVQDLKSNFDGSIK